VITERRGGTEKTAGIESRSKAEAIFDFRFLIFDYERHCFARSLGAVLMRRSFNSVCGAIPVGLVLQFQFAIEFRAVRSLWVRGGNVVLQFRCLFAADFRFWLRCCCDSRCFNYVKGGPPSRMDDRLLVRTRI